MTYKNSLQARFVSGRLTPIWLFTASLAMWLVGVGVDACIGEELTFKGYFLPLLFSLFCSIAATVILDVSHLFERRVRWLSAMFMWLTAISFSIHDTEYEALAVLLLAIIVYKLFKCKQGEDTYYGLYSVFAIVGCAYEIFPQFLLLLPVFAIYASVAMMTGFRGILAILLGFFTPYLIISGTDYIFPEIMPAFMLGNRFEQLLTFSIAIPNLVQTISMALHAAILIPFAVIFFNSPIPGKPYLRRRLTFLIYLNILLLILPLFYNNDFSLFYMMSLPSVAVMMGYIFTLKTSKPMNWFFIIINILWIALFPFSVCSKYLLNS